MKWDITEFRTDSEKFMKRLGRNPILSEACSAAEEMLGPRIYRAFNSKLRGMRIWKRVIAGAQELSVPDGVRSVTRPVFTCIQRRLPAAIVTVRVSWSRTVQLLTNLAVKPER